MCFGSVQHIVVLELFLGRNFKSCKKKTMRILNR